jgi:hypothetical protein
MSADGRKKKLIPEADFERLLHRAQTAGALLGALLPLAALLILTLSGSGRSGQAWQPTPTAPKATVEINCLQRAARPVDADLQAIKIFDLEGELLPVSFRAPTEELKKIDDLSWPEASQKFRISGFDDRGRSCSLSYSGSGPAPTWETTASGIFAIKVSQDLYRVPDTTGAGSARFTSPTEVALIPRRPIALPAFVGFAGLTLGMAALFRAGSTRIVTTRYQAAELVPAGRSPRERDAYGVPGDAGIEDFWEALHRIKTVSNDEQEVGSQPAPTAPPSPLPSGPPAPTHALLRCPEVVVVEEEIELEVGISPVPMDDVEGEPLRAPAVPEYRLTLHVLAQGFRLRPGESWRNELKVMAARPFPSIVLHLTAEPQDSQVRSRRIRANYLVEGQSIGFAVRAVSVVEHAGLREQVEARPHPAASTIGVPGAESAAALTITILQEDSDRGELLWTFATPHAGIQVPDQPISKDVGSDPARFARQLVEKVNAREGKVGLYSFLRGIGREIADHVPPPVWNALREIGAKSPGKPPTVLILSEEPYIPWELAVMPQPLDAATPPFLAAQASVGRWVLPEADRPRVPPPLEVEVRSAAVISGVYDSPTWRRLEEAEEEARQLAQQYRSVVSVDATHRMVTRCLGGDPEADLLHFAVHGIYDPNGIQNGLVLVDEATLDPYDVKGVDLRRSPFVFLNACQVGAGDRILGDYAGPAAAFLYAGASGVIAPLWSVKDTLAREIALEFYRKVAAGEQPALILREERAKFRESDDPVSATYLAYQFFGHPELRLRGLTPQGTNP